MDVDLVFKIAAIGILVAVLNILLSRAGRDEQALMTTIAGLVVVLVLVIQKISELFDLIKSLFSCDGAGLSGDYHRGHCRRCRRHGLQDRAGHVASAEHGGSTAGAVFVHRSAGAAGGVFRDAIAVSKLSGVYTGPLLKCMTISILTMIGRASAKTPDRLPAPARCSSLAWRQRSMPRCR